MVSSSAIRTNFHSNVTKLYQKTREPSAPINYRGRQYTSSSSYVLLHEEEQHLADGLAFLAQSKEGPDCVSAVMLEQRVLSGSMGLVVRLASNKTPAAKTVEGLRVFLEAVGEYARAGRGREMFFVRLFGLVLDLSKERLLWRIRSSHFTKRIWPPVKNTSRGLLQERIDTLLTDLSHQNSNPKYESLLKQLGLLRESLVALEHSASENVMDALQVVVQRSWAVSTFNNSKSLGTQLQDFGATEDLYQSRIVLDIDKISRYLEICRELMRFSRRKTSRDIFSNISLEVCTAPPSSQPLGSRTRCCVHGEVQLVLYYEQHSSQLPPRCIGSSKSACFLCDLFIQEHGRYHISHTHKRLYEKWTIPVAEWMSPAQVTKFETILDNINQELVHFLQTKIPSRPNDNGPESRVHLLLLPDGALVPSPMASIISEAKPQISKATSTAKLKASTSTLILNTITPIGTPSVSVYGLINLPLLLNITTSTKSSTILTKNIAYIFDLEDFHCGQLQISEYTNRTRQRNVLRVNSCDPVLDSILSLREVADEHVLTFCVHDDNHHELQVVIRWFKTDVS